MGDTCASRMGAGGDPGPVDPGASEPPPEGGQHAHMEPALEWALGYRCPMPPTVQLLEGPGGSSVLTLAGPLDVRSAAGVRRDLTRRLAGARIASLDIDVSGLERGDMSGMAILYELIQGRFTPGVKARLIGLRPELQKILAPFCPRVPPSAEPARLSR